MALAFDTRELSAGWLDGTHKRRLIVLTAGTAIVSIVLARMILMWDLAVVAGVLVSLALAAILARPRYGVYLLLGVILFFEGGSEDPLMLPGNYLNRSLQETLHLPGAIFFPIEILVLVITIIWLARGLMRNRLDFQGGSLGRPMLFFAGALLFGMARGLAAGAVFNYSFWESRFLFAMVLSYMLASNMIRTRGSRQNASGHRDGGGGAVRGRRRVAALRACRLRRARTSSRIVVRTRRRRGVGAVDPDGHGPDGVRGPQMATHHRAPRGPDHGPGHARQRAPSGHYRRHYRVPGVFRDPVLRQTQGVRDLDRAHRDRRPHLYAAVLE